MQATITKSSPSAVWKTLVSGSAKLFHKFQAVTRNEGAEWDGVRKICDFQPIQRWLSETGGALWWVQEKQYRCLAAGRPAPSGDWFCFTGLSKCKHAPLLRIRLCVSRAFLVQWEVCDFSSSSVASAPAEIVVVAAVMFISSWSWLL